jgi:hypothetical protein
MSMQKGTEQHKWAGLATIPVNEIVFHEHAQLFPRIPDPELEALGKDMKENGIKTPIVLTKEGLCCDGMNRVLASTLMGIKEIPFETIDLEGDQLLDYVIGLNLRRRHLTGAQRACVAAKLADGTHGGDRTNPQTCGLTQKQAAALFRISERSVQSATYLQEHGVEELQDAVLQGEVAVSTAAKVATLPPEDQQAVVIEGPQAVRKKGQELRKHPVLIEDRMNVCAGREVRGWRSRSEAPMLLIM